MPETSASMWPLHMWSIAWRSRSPLAQFAAKWFVGAGGDEVDTKFAFGRLDGFIDVGRRRHEAFQVEQHRRRRTDSGCAAMRFSRAGRV
jgi:hypothetical protein